MHMRTKKWAKPELSVCPFFTDDPERFRGIWRKQFVKNQPLYVELGCGKGVSTAQMIHAQQNANFIAIDITSNVLGDARRNLKAAFGDEPVQNAMLARYDITMINRILAPEDEVDRIIIQFCNPWTKREKYAKRRLTHPRQLLQYREMMKDGAEIWFKTDNEELFHDSLLYFEVCGFERVYETWDLHTSGFMPNYPSEHEIRFSQEGIPIKFVIVKKGILKEAFDPLRWHLPEEDI